MTKVWIIGTVLLLSLAYYRLIARPLFQQDRSGSCLPRWVQSTAIVVWFGTQLHRIKDKAILYTEKIWQLYSTGVLYMDNLKVIVNFLQIVGSFARHAWMHASTHAHTHRHTHMNMLSRAHTCMHGACTCTSTREHIHMHAPACPMQDQNSFPQRIYVPLKGLFRC